MIDFVIAEGGAADLAVGPALSSALVPKHKHSIGISVDELIEQTQTLPAQGYELVSVCFHGFGQVAVTWLHRPPESLPTQTFAFIEPGELVTKLIARYVIGQLPTMVAAAGGTVDKSYYFFVFEPGPPPWTPVMPPNVCLGASPTNGSLGVWAAAQRKANRRIRSLSVHGTLADPWVAGVAVSNLPKAPTRDGFKGSSPVAWNLLVGEKPETLGEKLEAFAQAKVRPELIVPYGTQDGLRYLALVYDDHLANGSTYFFDSIGEFKGVREALAQDQVYPVRVSISYEEPQIAAIFAKDDRPVPRVWRRAAAGSEHLGPNQLPPVDPFAALDAYFKDRLRAWSVRGCQLAVVRNGELKCLRAYTWAEPDSVYPTVKHTSTFWIGSMAKTLTALAIARLVELGQFTLQTTFAEARGVSPADDYLAATPIWRILKHVAALPKAYPSVSTVKAFLKPNDPGDPALNPLEAGDYDGYLMSTDPVHAESLIFPLTGGLVATNYSNRGFFLLGRVVEYRGGLSLTGQLAYPDVIRKLVLEPLGIPQGRAYVLGEADTGQSEVLHHMRAPSVSRTLWDASGAWVPSHYDRKWTYAGGSGTWAMCALDYAKVLAAFALAKHPVFDGASTLTDLWDEAGGPFGWGTYDPLPNARFAPVKTIGKVGSFTTECVCAVREDGLGFVILPNSKPTDDLKTVVVPAVNMLLNQVKEWPSEDLFAAFP